MNITQADLREQFDRAITNWPWIRTVENDLAVPPFLLYAIGSRETNLRNVVGDGGHGHGIWQRDDRSWTIPADYLQTPGKQANDAANLLMSLQRRFEVQPNAWTCAIAAYNAGGGSVARALANGQEPDSVTTGRDYAADVVERWNWMLHWRLRYA